MIHLPRCPRVAPGVSIATRAIWERVRLALGKNAKLQLLPSSKQTKRQRHRASRSWLKALRSRNRTSEGLVLSWLRVLTWVDDLVHAGNRYPLLSDFLRISRLRLVHSLHSSMKKVRRTNAVSDHLAVENRKREGILVGKRDRAPSRTEFSYRVQKEDEGQHPILLLEARTISTGAASTVSLE